MAGNSQRKGAIRKPGTKKGQVVGSGGRRKRGLEGKGPTPKAADRPAHPAARRAAKAQSGAGSQGGKRGPGSGGETVAGRNPVAEAMRAGVPATAVYVAERIDADDRVRDIVRLAADRDLPLMEVPRAELDRLTRGATHQGVAVTVPAYDYAHPGDLLDLAHDAGQAPLVVALDGVTDARNLGAIVRSAAAFGAHGVLVPKRRSAGMTAGAWKTSAGAAAQLPVAQATNLARELRSYQEAGVFIIGLDGSGDTPITDEAATDLFAGPVCLVAGSEGKGLSQVVASACDLVVNIPMAGTVESLNAGVATSVALYEAARARNDHVHHP